MIGIPSSTIRRKDAGMEAMTSYAVCDAQPSGGHPLLDAFRDHLNDGDLDQAIASEGVAFRKRDFPPAVTFWTFLIQVFHVGASCRNALIRLRSVRPGSTEGQSPPIRTGTYCKARQRLPESLLNRLARLVADRADSEARPWDWKGHSVKMVDGTTVSMPDTRANQEAFPQAKNQKPGLGFPVTRLVAVIGLACGCVVRTALAPWAGKGRGEGSLLAGILDAFRPNELLIGDRYYSVYWLLASLSGRGVYYVGALAKTRRPDYRTGRRLGPTDRVGVWHKPPRYAKQPGLSDAAWEALPECIEVRRMRIRLDKPGFRTQILHLVTTLLDAERYSKGDVAGLYRHRWQIELHFRALKEDMEMGILRCKSPQMIRKEIAMHMIVYTLVRAVMVRAAMAVQRVPYRMSFTAAREAIEAYSSQLADPTRREAARKEMFELIGSQHIDDRPGRLEPRCLKRTPKDCEHMTKPRTQYHRVTRSVS